VSNESAWVSDLVSLSFQGRMTRGFPDYVTIGSSW
jgi:hypothetical protein